MPHKSNQKGFAVVEAVLIVIIVALVGFVGWYVWHSNQQAKATLDAANKSAQSSPSKVIKKSSSSSNTNSRQGFLNIKEWKIKVPVDDSTAGLRYVLRASFATFTDDRLQSFCSMSTDTENRILVARGTAKDLVPNETGDNERTFASLASDSPDSVYAKSGDYYFVEPDVRGAACATSAADVDKEAAAAQAIISSLRNITAI